jgi:hypothetical protein
MNAMRTVSTPSLACLAACLLIAVASARAQDCAALVRAASMAQVKVPHAVTHVMTMAGKPPMRFDMIFIADKSYTKVNGAWSVIPISVQDQIELINQSAKRPHPGALLAGRAGESINGEPTSLVTIQEASGKIAEDRLWLSGKTGLPLKSEVRMHDGSSISDEFRYDNVQAPANVK